jgi:hypothetical protein
MLTLLLACAPASEPQQPPAPVPVSAPAQPDPVVPTTCDDDEHPCIWSGSACVVAAEAPAPSIRDEWPVGDLCSCGPDGTCNHRSVEPVPCQSAADCWVEGQGADAHPIPRPAPLKGREFEPCKDGERAPVCIDSHCSMNTYRC